MNVCGVFWTECLQHSHCHSGMVGLPVSQCLHWFHGLADALGLPMYQCAGVYPVRTRPGTSA